MKTAGSFVMAKSYLETGASGSNDVFGFSFGYIDRSHVYARVDDATVQYEWINESTVRLLEMPQAGSVVRIYRNTPTDPLVDFKDGVTLVDEALDTANLQSLYIQQENDDANAEFLGLTSDGNFDAEGSRVKNAGEPVDPEDLATKAYVDAAPTRVPTAELFMGKTPGLEWDAQGQRVTNMRDPESPGNAATKKYVDASPGPAGGVSVAQFADLVVGNDWTAAFQAAIDALPAGGGTILLGDENYSVNSAALTSDAGKKITWKSERALVNGALAWDVPGIVKRDNLLRQETDKRNDPITLQLQRIVRTDDGYANPKCLRAVTVIEDTDNTQTEYAVSGELMNYSDSASQGNTAVSGTAFKYGQAGVFGGHFQANEMYKHDTNVVSPIVGCEMNIKAIGEDSPGANEGTGNRRVLDILARTNEPIDGWDHPVGNFGDAEIGVGISVRSDNLTNGWFRNAILVHDGNVPSTTGVRVRTAGSHGIVVEGDNTIAQILSQGSPTYGAIFSGSYGTAAVRVNSDQRVAFSSDATAFTRFNSTLDTLEFWRGGSKRVSINMTPGLGEDSPLTLNFSNVLKEVTQGAEDSSRPGYRVLEVPN